MQTIHRTRPRTDRSIPWQRAATGLCTFTVAWMAAFTPAAQAAPKEKPAHATVVKAKKPGKVKFENRSGETTAERDRRLLRECKGRPNAGACLGYTG